jgi:4-amino-4-deoxy-L-arabinose transferase-like glycosyltransferase
VTLTTQQKNITWLQNGALSIASLILLASLVVYVAYALNLMSFPFDYDQGEGFELVDTIMFSQFQMPYQNSDTFPFYSSNYPPLYHMLLAPMVWFFGPAYWYGRMAGFLFTLIAALIITWAVHRETNHRWVAVLSGLAYLASNTIYHIGPLFRQHATMVTFEVAAVVLLATAFPQRRKGRILLAFALLIAAGYTKQLAAITAIAVLAWAFVQNPRRAILWGIGFAGVGVGIFAWLTLATQGEWWRQTIVANVNPFYPFQAISLFELWFKLHGFLIVVALLYLIRNWLFERVSVYSVWFVAAVVLGGFGAGTWGAGDSYYATAIAAMCIMSGIFMGRLLQQDAPQSVALKATLALGVGAIYSLYGVATWKMPTDGIWQAPAQLLGVEANTTSNHFDSATYLVDGYARIGHFLTQEDLDAGNAILERVRETESLVLSEEASFSLLAGRDVITNPTQLLNLDRAGLFNGEELITMLEEQAFGLIILRAQFYPTPVLVAITTYYEHDEVIRMNGFDYMLLRPRVEPLTDESDT